jgi:hypothetical protein
MKARCALRDRVFSALFWCSGPSQPHRKGGNPALPLRDAAKCEAIPGGKLGEKIPPNFLSLHVFADRFSVAPLGNVFAGNKL